jgi:hypothetical protein
MNFIEVINIILKFIDELKRLFLFFLIKKSLMNETSISQRP